MADHNDDVPKEVTRGLSTHSLKNLCMSVCGRCSNGLQHEVSSNVPYWINSSARLRFIFDFWNFPLQICAELQRINMSWSICLRLNRDFGQRCSMWCLYDQTDLHSECNAANDFFRSNVKWIVDSGHEYDFDAVPLIRNSSGLMKWNNGINYEIQLNRVFMEFLNKIFLCARK